MALTSRRGRPVVAETLKVAYFGVPKVASTTLKHTLWQLETGEPFTREAKGGRMLHHVLPTREVDPATAFDGLDGFWKFTVVRDPVERLISVYRNRVRHHEDLRKARHAGLLSWLLWLKLDPSFEEFCARLPAYKRTFRQIRHHMGDTSLFTGPDLGRLDRVYRMDELPALAEDLRRITGREVELGRLQTGGRNLERPPLSPQVVRHLRRHLAAEYAFLSDYFQPPWDE